MRPLAARLALPVLALAAAVSVASAETTRTVRAELSADAIGHFAVENLVGTMKIVPGPGRQVVVVGEVHAESDRLARTITIEQVAGRLGVPTLRVRYPLDDERTLRYPGPDKGKKSEGLLESWFGGLSTSTEYDGRKVKISSWGGTLLYVDVQVQVPRHLDDATFRNMVGLLEGSGMDGKILFDASSGDIDVDSVKGEIRTDTGSGDVKAGGLEGSFSCDTGSGDCDLTDFTGDTVHCEVGSGDATIRKVTALHMDVHTGSGDVRVTEGDLEEFSADTGSGSVRLDNRGNRLKRVKAGTGSGDVVLRLAPDASFEALADQGSGDLLVHYKDAQPILRRKEVIGYRRGDARTRIDVDTGSGDLTIEPGT